MNTAEIIDAYCRGRPLDASDLQIAQAARERSIATTLERAVSGIATSFVEDFEILALRHAHLFREQLKGRDVIEIGPAHRPAYTDLKKFGIGRYTAVEAFETKSTGGALNHILDQLPKAQGDAAYREMTLSDKDGLTYLINQPDESAIVMSFGVLCPWLQQHENTNYYRFLAREIYRVTPQGGISVHVVNSGGGWEEMFSTAGFDTIPSRTSHHIIVQKPHTT